MATDQVLDLLIAERNRLSRAIEILQTNHAPHGTASTMKAGVAGGSRRGHMSPSARKAQSARMKAYWQARRKKAAAGKKTA